MEGARSVIICPLKAHDGLIGMLEIIATKDGILRPQHITKVEDVLPLFTLGLEKSLERLNSEVDTVIKKKFTSVQPAVEWRFTEAALNYIVKKHINADTKIERIAFHDVHPIYGAIDIRNSSTERSKSIQADIIDQLQLARHVVEKAKSVMTFPLLEEIEFKIDKFIIAASDVLKSEEELNIHDFMQGQVLTILNHHQNTQYAIKNKFKHFLLIS